ncbi:hypothetical protein ACOMHN_027543 [Nucella lapillus]
MFQTDDIVLEYSCNTDTSCEGTFNTGPAQLDKRGSIRRGDVKLPVVDGLRSKPHSPDTAHDDSGISSSHRSSASRDRGAPESGGRPEKSPDSRESSPRYVDHNKLFPETPLKASTSSIKESGYAAFYKDNIKYGEKNSPGRLEQKAESDIKPKRKEGSRREEKHVSENNTFLVNGESSDKGDDDQKIKTEPSSTVDQTQKPKNHEKGTLTLLSARSSESNQEVLSDRKSKKSIALNRLKRKEEHSFSNIEQENHRQHGNITSESGSPRSQREQTAQQPTQKQQRLQLQKQQHQNQDLQKSTDTETKETAKTPATTLSTSLEHIQKKQLSPKSTSTVETTSHQIEKPQQKHPQQRQNRQQQEQQQKQQQQQQQHQKQQQQQQQQQQQPNIPPTVQAFPLHHTEQKRDTSVTAATTSAPPHPSTQTPSQKIPRGSTPAHQPNPILLSTPRGSAPPKDHQHEANNPSAKNIDTPRDRKQTAKVAPQSVTEADGSRDKGDRVQDMVKPEPNAAAKGSTPKVQPQNKPTNPMAQKRENGLDSLAQVSRRV